MMYICSSCKANVSVTEKVNHVKSDWHIYNLKRVVSGLLPISEDIFVHKKQLFDTESPAIEKETYCRACKKSFSNSKSFSAHLISKRHLHNSQFSQEKISTQSAITCTESAEENCTTQSIPLGSCLFCDRHISLGPVTNNSLDDAQKRDLAKRVLNHMLDAHNFTVPFPEKLIDPAGLLVELGRIVGEERSCLACGRQFYGSHLERSENIRISLSAVRSHMLDKPGHKQVWYGIEDPVQLALLMAETEHESDGHDKRNFPKAALAGGELFSQFYDQSVVAAPFILSDDEDVYEVRLPSGTVLGHRKMRTFYKQHLSTNLQLAPFNKAKLSSCGSGQKCVSISHSDLNTTIQKGFNRDPRRYLNEQKKYWDLINGVQGNLCNRLHLRRQY